MNQIKGYNRNLIGGKRPYRKITKFGKYFGNSSERLIAESKALTKYLIRVNQNGNR